MTFSTNFTSFCSSISTQPGDAVASSIAVFQALSVDDQLAVLWYAYTEIGINITPAATGVARLQLAEGLLNQVKQMSQEEQLQVQRDLVARKNTPLCRAYGVLSANTKLAFWYELAELMAKDIVVPMPSGYQLSRDGQQVMQTLRVLEFGQQITVLRKVLTDMGYDPFAD